jgi:hypothetical protein
MYFYAKVTGWIVVPLVVAVFFGRYAESSLGGQIWFFGCIIIAFIFTCYGIYQEIKIYKQEIDK